MFEQTRGARQLDLRVGELVETLTADSILPTLDTEGKVDGLPFMPEMLSFLGKRFRVVKRVDKICDTITKSGLARLTDTVLLEGVRCDGQSHGRCQAACMILWKECWLKRVSVPSGNGNGIIAIKPTTALREGSEGDSKDILRALVGTKASKVADNTSEAVRYMCQVTEMKQATCPMASWDLRQYWRDVRSGNLDAVTVVRGVLIMLFNFIQELRGGCQFPFMPKPDRKQTPKETLNLQVGDLVRVKSPEAIQKTLDANHKNRGLWFDKEMLQYCGGTYRVRGRVQRLINERTGVMINLSNDCLILDDVICKGSCHQFCPRSEFIYWREIWLDPVPSRSEDRCLGKV